MATTGVEARGREVAGVPGGRLLVALFGGAIAWTLHLFASYLVVALWCSSRWRGLGVATAVVTVLCVAIAVAVTVLAWRLWQRGRDALRSDAAPGALEGWDSRLGERGARAAFLALLALFLDLLFAYLILLEGLPPIFTPACPAWMSS